MTGFDIRDFVFGGRWWQPIDKRIRPDLYDWSAYSPLKKHELVKNTLFAAVKMVLAGEAASVEDVLRSAIAKVEIGESWPEWKSKNPGFVDMMHQAQQETDSVNNLIAAVQSGQDVSIRLRNLHFQYIDKNTLNSLLSVSSNVMAASTTQSSFRNNAAFGGGFIEMIKRNPTYAALGGAALFIGIIAFSSAGKGQNYIQTKQLT